jgi:recA bacterial DNA recombination protein
MATGAEKEGKPTGRALRTGAKPAVQSKQTFSLKSFKTSLGLTGANVQEKTLEYYDIEGAIPGTFPMKEVTGIGGPAIGYVNIVRGHTNTGKSTYINACIKAVQKRGDIPVIMDTESNFSFRHAEECGVEVEWVPDENGELQPEGNFIYINNQILFQMIGASRTGKKKDGTLNRYAPTIEDLAHFCQMLRKKQRLGEIQGGLCFLWDAMGTIGSDASLEGENHNNMWDAAAMNLNFRDIWFTDIPSTRMVTEPYTNTFIIVAKIRHDSMVGGAGTTRQKGGELAWQAARLVFQLGNSVTHGTALMKATANKKDFVWGIAAKVVVVKNHVEGASYAGKLISTPWGYIAGTPEAEAQFKKLYNKKIIAKLELVEEDANPTVEFVQVGEVDMSAE